MGLHSFKKKYTTSSEFLPYIIIKKKFLAQNSLSGKQDNSPDISMSVRSVPGGHHPDGMYIFLSGQ